MNETNYRSVSTIGPVRLERAFFERPALRVARDLLGKVIVRRYRNNLLTGIIVETEAYRGPEDKASHAFGGRRTPAVEALYRQGGSLHLYFVYGMHWLLNFKASAPCRPQGVLIRGIVAEAGSGSAIISGPGRVTRHFKVGRSLYGEDSVFSSRLWIEDRGIAIPKSRIRRGPRVGIDYAGPYWRSRPWRFQLDESFFETL